MGKNKNKKYRPSKEVGKRPKTNRSTSVRSKDVLKSESKNPRQKSQRALLALLSKEQEKKGIASQLVSLLKRCISQTPVQESANVPAQGRKNKNKHKSQKKQQSQQSHPQKNVSTTDKNATTNVEKTPTFVPPQRTESRRIVISAESLETRVALMTGKRLDEYEIERTGVLSASGAIYFGRVCNHEPSLEAAFVDIGEEKNAFLHFRDMLPAAQDIEERVTSDDATQKRKPDFNTKLAERLRAIKENEDKEVTANEIVARNRRRNAIGISLKDAPKLFPAKSEVVVQVSKAPIGTKGARVTTNISIPGRYLVLLPYTDDICISKKIDDRKERARLREILTSFNLPKGLGVICRTVGEGRKREHFENDLNMLLEIWQGIQNKIRTQKPPYCLYREPSLIDRTIRDFLTEDIDEVIIDNAEVYHSIMKRLKSLVGNKRQLRVKLHQRPQSVFDSYGISTQISQIFARTVPLKSGGYLCIEETEALVTVDVNTGKSRGGKSLPETIFNTNLEAAEEIARQIRLRNIGGLVVIDFIDMMQEKQRKDIYHAMKSFCSSDRVKTEIAPLSRFGLMEMTRRREQESILHAVYDSCPYCDGRGKIRSVFSMSVEIHRRLLQLLQRRQSSEGVSLRVLMHPAVLARMRKEDTQSIDALEQKYHCVLSFRPDESLHLEEFKIVDPVTLNEVL